MTQSSTLPSIAAQERSELPTILNLETPRFDECNGL
jgi:hypothetical protein